MGNSNSTLAQNANPSRRPCPSDPPAKLAAEYPVNSLALAAFLKARGFRLLRLVRASRNGSQWAIFVFEDDGQIAQARRDYFAYRGQVDGRTLAESYGQLKSQASEKLQESNMDANTTQ